MRPKLYYLMLVIVTILIVGTSCSNDDRDITTSSETKDVTVAVNMAKITSKAAGESAREITPEVKDLTLYFADASDIIVSTHEFPIGLTSNGEIKDNDKKTFIVPSAAVKIYAIGNTATISGSIALPTVTIGVTPLSTVQASLLNIAKQTNPKTAINVKSDIATLNPPTSGNINYSATLTIKPATARIEIQEIKSDRNVSIPLTSFKLTGIYVNNTYTHFGLDESTKGSEVKYGKDASDAPAWVYGGTFPAIFKDEPSKSGESLGVGNGTSYTPSSNAGDVWGYFLPATITNDIPPASSKPGTIIDGIQYDAVPHIILKIENATSDDITYPSLQYVTIRGFKTISGTSVTRLEAGNYYLIKSINIGGEHLSSDPEDTNVKADVTVTILKWNEVEIIPNL